MEGRQRLKGRIEEWRRDRERRERRGDRRKRDMNMNGSVIMMTSGKSHV